MKLSVPAFAIHIERPFRWLASWYVYFVATTAIWMLIGRLLGARALAYDIQAEHVSVGGVAFTASFLLACLILCWPLMWPTVVPEKRGT